MLLGHEFDEEVIPIINLSKKALLGSPSGLAINSAHAIAFHRGLGTALHPTSSTPITKYLNEKYLEAFSHVAYAKPNFSVVANGTSHVELSKWVGEFFIDSASAPPPDLPPIDTSPSKYYGGEERIAHDSGNTMIIAFPGSSSFTGGAYKPEIPVLAALLGGESTIKWSPGFSLLSKATAEYTQAYINTTHITYSDTGLLQISLSGNAKDIKKASEAVVKTLKAVASGNITKDEFQKAVAAARFKALDAGQNIGAGLELTGAGLIQGGRAFQIDEVGKSIEKVTEDLLKKVGASRTFGFDRLLNSHLQTDHQIAARWQSYDINSWRFVCFAFCRRDWIKRLKTGPGRAISMYNNYIYNISVRANLTLRDAVCSKSNVLLEYIYYLALAQ